jgi:Flp pilus assembly protein TadB
VSHFATSYTASKVKHQFQIVFSKRPSAEGTPPTGRLGRFYRITNIFVGALFLGAAFAVLVVILILGSILAAIIWMALVVGIFVLILKEALRRASRQDGQKTKQYKE